MDQTAQRAAQLRTEVNAVIDQLSTTVLDEDLNAALQIIAEIPKRVQAAVASVVRRGEPSFDNKYLVTLTERQCSRAFAPGELQVDRVTNIVFDHLTH